MAEHICGRGDARTSETGGIMILGRVRCLDCVIRAINAHKALAGFAEEVMAKLVEDAETCCPSKTERWREIYEHGEAAMKLAKD